MLSISHCLPLCNSLPTKLTFQNSSFAPLPLFLHSYADMKSCRTLRKRSTCCSSEKITFTRRSANYHPSIWNHQVIQLTTAAFNEERLVTRLEELKAEVGTLLKACNEPSAKIQLIDWMQRLGVAYHFEEEINDALNQIYFKGSFAFDDLCDTSLCFRLLRQHGYYISCDVFERFRDKGGFRSCHINDTKGLLSLYEASYLEVDGEEVLEEAKEFSMRHLKSLPRELVDFNIMEQVKHTLEVPLHWRMPRLEYKYFIDIYQYEEESIPILLELAKLDYNIVQSLHQEDMKTLSWWWEELGEKPKFARDRLLENYLWAVGIASEPQFSDIRILLAKIISILTVMDDIYDVYGFMDEVELFTSSLKRWHLEAMDDLPEYMKWCYKVLYQITKDVSSDIEKKFGWDATVFIKREWENLCGAYLVEAQWWNKGYQPTLEEYLSNAWVSVAGPLCLSHAYLILGNKLTENSNDSSQKESKDRSGIMYWSSLIARLTNDLGTSEAEKGRGDISKSIQCRQNETGDTEEASVEYIKVLVSHCWKELNKERLSSHLPRNFTNMAVNMARTAHCIYQHGDGVGISTGITKNKIESLFSSISS